MVEVEIDQSIYLPVYQQIVGSDADIVFFWGGRDSGKTHHIAQELIVKCMEADYFRCILVKKTYESIKDSQFQTIKDIVYELGLESLFTFREHPLEIQCINGNKFIARGCDKPEKIKSVRNPSDVWYEEMDQLTHADHITVQTTLRSDQVKVKEWCSFNPECKGDYHDFYLYKWVGDNYAHFREVREIELKDETVSITIEGIHSTYDDNPYCTADRKARHENLAQSDPYYYQVYRRGRWGRKAALRPFAMQFDRKQHVSNVAQFDPGRLIFITFDFNLDPFGFIFTHRWMDKSGPHVHLFDEAKIPSASLEDGLDWITETYGRFSHNFIIDGDYMGKKRDFGRRDNLSYYDRIKNHFRLRDIQIQAKTNPEHKTSRQDVNYFLKHFPDIKINLKCRETISDLENVEVDAYEKIIKSDRANENQRADFLDGFRYMVNSEFVQKWLKAHQKI